MVTSCRPNGRSSSRAKPRRYSNTSLAEGIFSRWTVVAPRTRSVTLKASPSGTTSSTSPGQLLDELHGLEGIDLRVVRRVADLGHQRGVHILAVGDGGLGDAAPQLLHQHLAASLAGDPFVVGGEADADGFHAARVRKMQCNRPARVKNWGFQCDCSFLLADGVHAALRDRRDDAVGRVVDRRAFHGDRDELVRLARSPPWRRRPSAT